VAAEPPFPADERTLPKGNSIDAAAKLGLKMPLRIQREGDAELLRTAPCNPRHRTKPCDREHAIDGRIGRRC
jgi:hypothetical protein